MRDPRKLNLVPADAVLAAGQGQLEPVRRGGARRAALAKPIQQSRRLGWCAKIMVRKRPEGFKAVRAKPTVNLTGAEVAVSLPGLRSQFIQDRKRQATGRRPLACSGSCHVQNFWALLTQPTQNRCGAFLDSDFLQLQHQAGTLLAFRDVDCERCDSFWCSV
jgi:hypothetical protein